MAGSISNTFGFNMGAKMGDFGFFEANGGAPPINVEPKYIVLQVELSTNSSIQPNVQNQINTTTATISSSQNGGTAPNFYYTIGFDQPFATTSDNVYVEGYFNNAWIDSTTTTTPLFQVYLGNSIGAGLDEILITAVDYDQTQNGANGTLNLLLMIFE